MTDNGDQDALNALVDDCYAGLWPWDDIHRYPLVGTWVIGSLIEKMGEAFWTLEHHLSTDIRGEITEDFWKVTYFEKEGTAADKTIEGDTPIQALCAALRETLKKRR
jgi:hypothetical protein